MKKKFGFWNDRILKYRIKPNIVAKSETATSRFAMQLARELLKAPDSNMAIARFSFPAYDI